MLHHFLCCWQRPCGGRGISISVFLLSRGSQSSLSSSSRILPPVTLDSIIVVVVVAREPGISAADDCPAMAFVWTGEGKCLEGEPTMFQCSPRQRTSRTGSFVVHSRRCNRNFWQLCLRADLVLPKPGSKHLLVTRRDSKLKVLGYHVDFCPGLLPIPELCNTHRERC